MRSCTWPPSYIGIGHDRRDRTCAAASEAPAFMPGLSLLEIVQEAMISGKGERVLCHGTGRPDLKPSMLSRADPSGDRLFNGPLPIYDAQADQPSPEAAEPIQCHQLRLDDREQSFNEK
jgi:hypothetical protein